MQDLPDLPDLLSTARAKLLDTILPLVAPGARRDVLMVARALSICERGLARGSAPWVDEQRELADLLGRPRSSDLKDLKDLNAQFARAIRAGTFDPGTTLHEPARAAVMSLVLRKLGENHPKSLPPAAPNPVQQ